MSLLSSRVDRVLESKHTIEVAAINRVGFENIEQLDAASAVIAGGKTQLEGSRVRGRLVLRTVNSAFDEKCRHDKGHAPRAHTRHSAG